MPEATFISSEWIKPLWKKLTDLRGERKRELVSIGDTFGDPVELARYYIQPDCQHHNPADYNEEEPQSVVRSPVFKTIEHFLRGDFASRGDGRTQMFVLADAGMGKTSLLVMLKLAQVTSFWPPDHDCRLLKLGPKVLDEVAALKHKARTVLLLDALDEDGSAWGNVSARLTDILSKTTEFRRVIISCRTQFFPEGASDPFKAGRLMVGTYICPAIYLSLFDDDQVDEYLSKRFKKSWLDMLSGIHELKRKRRTDIVNSMQSLRLRPFLLAHIEDLLAANVSTWNDYTSYEALLKAWLLREERKLRGAGKTDLSCDDLMRACCIIAQEMQVKQTRSITSEHFARIALLDSKAAAMQYVDIGSRALLNRNSSGNLRFSHYTIQEYLIAYSILSVGLCYRPSSINLTPQIYRFVLFGLGRKIAAIGIEGYRNIGEIIRIALIEAERLNDISVSSQHLILALCKINDDNSRICESVGLSYESLARVFTPSTEHSWNGRFLSLDRNLKAVLRVALESRSLPEIEPILPRELWRALVISEDDTLNEILHKLHIDRAAVEKLFSNDSESRQRSMNSEK